MKACSFSPFASRLPKDLLCEVSTVLVGMFRPALKSFDAVSARSKGCETPAAPPKIFSIGFETAGWHVSPSPEKLRCSFSPLPRLRDCCRFQKINANPPCSSLDALRPTLYRIAWCKLEWQHDWSLLSGNPTCFGYKVKIQRCIKSPSHVKTENSMWVFEGNCEHFPLLKSR